MLVVENSQVRDFFREADYDRGSIVARNAEQND